MSLEEHSHIRFASTDDTDLNGADDAEAGVSDLAASAFPPPALPPHPTHPTHVSRASLYQVSDGDFHGPAHNGHDSSSDEDEDADRFHDFETRDGSVTAGGRARAGRTARIGHSADSCDDDDDDTDDETSMIIHSEVPHGRTTSMSQSALDHFASPPPPRVDVSSGQPACKMPPVPSPTNGKRGPPPPAVYASAAAAAAPASSSLSAAPAHARMISAGTAAATKEEIATICHYLRQAIQAKDMAAIGDLVARASEKQLNNELIEQARGMLLDARAEARDNEISTLKHYMRAAIEAKQKDACIDVLKKVEPLAATLSKSTERRLYSDFFTLVQECQACVEALEVEDAQTVSVYLKQGTQLRSREVLQAALSKATSVRHSLLDQSVLLQAKQLLSELDSQVMLRNFLALAIKNREPHALEESIAQAAKLHLAERDAPELAEARRLLDDLRAHPHSSGAVGGLGGGSSGSGGKSKEDKEARERERAQKAERKERERADKEAQKRADKETAAKEKAEKEAQKAAQQAEHDRVKDKMHNKGSWFGSAGGNSGSKASKESKDGGGTGALPNKLFGGSLHEAMRRNPSRSGIPRVVEECARYLRSHALDEPGLFRVAGNKDQIELLRDAFEADYSKEEKGEAPGAPPPLTEVHDASGLFKLYFRNLPEPLIPYDQYASLIKIGMNKGQDRVAQLTQLVRQLPKDNFIVLSYLCSFLHEVSTHSATNKMTPDNLGIVFAPNLLRPRVETPSSMMTEMPASISVIASFIAEFNTIFAGAHHAAGNGSAAAAGH